MADMIYSVVVYGVVWLSGLSLLAPSSVSLDEALVKLENWRREYTPSELDQWCVIIRQEARVGDGEVGGRLHNVVKSESVPGRVRRAALELAIAKANAHTAEDVVNTLADWCDPEQAPNQRELAVRGMLIWTAAVEHRGELERVMSNQEPLLKLLVRATKYGSLEMLYGLMTAIAESPAPLSQRQNAALSIIGELKDWTSCPKPLLRLLGPTAIPALREQVRQATSAEDFNLLAASVLAHLGDQEIVPDLQRWRPALADRAPVYSDVVGSWLWMIDAQHPPTKLLEAIRGKGGRWAIERAVELGIEREDIRKVVLEHVEDLQSRGVNNEDPRIVDIKAEALEVGVLAPDELPDVTIPGWLHDAEW